MEDCVRLGVILLKSEGYSIYINLYVFALL